MMEHSRTSTAERSALPDRPPARALDGAEGSSTTMSDPKRDRLRQALSHPSLPWILIALVGFGLRLLVSRVQSLGALNSDQAIPFLMAVDTSHGHPPLFVWGLSYGGAIEPWLVGAAMAIVGHRELWVMSGVASAVAMSAAMSWGWLTARLYGREAGLTCAVLLTFGSAVWLHWGVLDSSGYDLLILSPAIAGIGATISRTAPRRALMFGGTALTMFMSPLGSVVLLTAALAAVFAHRMRVVELGWWAAGGAVGLIPTLLSLVNGGSAIAPWASTRGVDLFIDFLIDAMPAALLVETPLNTEVGRTALTLALICFTGVLLGRRGAPRHSALVFIASTALLLLMVEVLRLQAVTGAFRYGFMLFPALAIMVCHGVASRNVRLNVTAVVIAATVIGLSVSSNGFDVKSDPHGDPQSRELIATLQEMGVKHAFGDFWLAYQVSSLSPETVEIEGLGSPRNKKWAANANAQSPVIYVLFRDGLGETTMAQYKDAWVGEPRYVGTRYAIYSVRPGRVPAKNFPISGFPTT